MCTVSICFLFCYSKSDESLNSSNSFKDIISRKVNADWERKADAKFLEAGREK